jgi:carbamoyltransferase
MRILAFHTSTHDASAAAFADYELIAAVQEERLRREKGWGSGVPWLAIDEVLRIAGWRRNDVDVIALIRGHFPRHYLRFPLPRELYYTALRWQGSDRPVRSLENLCYRYRVVDPLRLFRAESFLTENAFRPDTQVHFANHHEAHALTALFHTDWDEALLYTADGIGDNISYSIRSLQAGRIHCHFGDDNLVTARHLVANSLATAYAFATEACGFRMFRHEGKLTGLSARGEPKLAPALRRHFWLGDDGLIGSDFTSVRALERTVRDICRGHDRETIAASIQQVTEDVVSAAIAHWLKRTGARRLGLAGGLFANVRLNRLLAETLPLDEIFVFPAMGDDGLAVGGGLHFLMTRDGPASWLDHRRRLDHLYLGGDFDERIDAVLADDPRVRRLGGDPVETATDLVRREEIGAVYAGRMEYGPRALGARSIIASPAVADINESLNRRLDRSEFMPFAPYVLEEDAARVFEISDVNRYAARFMTITCAVRPEWRQKIPNVVHVDGTARPQIVREKDNPLFAGILRRFRDQTGLPVLINTSFNVHEEPIVSRPEECLQALIDGRIDFVATRRAVYRLGAPVGGAPEREHQTVPDLARSVR